MQPLTVPKTSQIPGYPSPPQLPGLSRPCDSPDQEFTGCQSSDLPSLTQVSGRKEESKGRRFIPALTFQLEFRGDRLAPKARERRKEQELKGEAPRKGLTWKTEGQLEVSGERKLPQANTAAGNEALEGQGGTITGIKEDSKKLMGNWSRRESHNCPCWSEAGPGQCRGQAGLRW